MEYLFDFGMATGPVLGYVHQISVIYSRKSVGAFSTSICAIILFANILRINFYVFKQYQLALLLQSLFMVVVQMLLVRICTKHSEGDTNSNMFWKWPHFVSYRTPWETQSNASLPLQWGPSSQLVSLSSCRYRFTDNQLGQSLSFLKYLLLTQSILILPQIVTIFQQRNAEGVSKFLLGLNLVGDIFKMIYFFVNDQPFQFKLCGLIQLILDSFVILLSIYFNYRTASTPEDQDALKEFPDGNTEGNQITSNLSLQPKAKGECGQQNDRIEEEMAEAMQEGQDKFSEQLPASQQEGDREQ